MLKDYSRAFDGCAIYLPALSANYAEFAATGKFKRLETLIPNDLNFLSPDSRLFYYPFALYSAGQGAQTDSSAQKDNIVLRRDWEATRIVGDSGGFQVATDSIEWEGEETALRLLDWMERHADYCMALDFPTGGIDGWIIAKHTKRLKKEGVNITRMAKANGLGEDYSTCLYQTLQNNKLFKRKALISTKLLNVIQGRNAAEAMEWLKRVRKIKMKGWAFAGYPTRDFALLMRLLIKMLDDGDLDNTEWLHFLGVGRLEPGCLYTTIQQEVTKHLGHQVQVTYDASSPSKSYANGSIYSRFKLHPSGWTVRAIHYSKLLEARNPHLTMMDALVSLAKSSEKSDERKAQESEEDDFFAEALGIGIDADIYDLDVEYLIKLTKKLDIKAKNTELFAKDSMSLHYGLHIFPGESQIAHLLYLNKAPNSFLSNGELDVDTDMLAINHNTQVLVDAHRRAQMAYAEKDTKQVPWRLLVAGEAIRQIFKSGTPYSLIDECEHLLDFT